MSADESNPLSTPRTDAIFDSIFARLGKEEMSLLDAYIEVVAFARALERELA